MNHHTNQFSKVSILYLLFLVLFTFDSPSTLSANVADSIENKVEEYLKEHEKDIAGLATMVIDEDKLIYKMKGYADIENQIPVTEDTVFEWGSVSKILIWISVMQLVEQGQIDLETDIKTYLPDDFRTKNTYEEPVTMRHLMHHTAGFDDSYTDLMIHHPPEKHTLKEVLENADIKQVFPPGDVVAYSNYGSGLAAYIVEEVSGIDYHEYVQQNIFKPLHMTKTAIDRELDDNEWVREARGEVEGYTYALQLIEPNFYTIPMYPVGSATGTAADLQRLMQALLAEDNTPLFKNKETLDQLFEPTLYYPGTTIPRIANGFFYLPSKSQHVYGHGGNSKAFSSSFYVDRNERTGVIVLTNIKNESTFTTGIPELIFGEYVHVENNGNLEESSKWNGVYEPARLPSSGFSKVYGLFLRGKTTQSESNHLAINGLQYTQLEPGIYKTEDSPSLYSLDVYSEHPQLQNVLSNTYSDLLYVPYYNHVLEWGGLVFCAAAILFSFIYVIIAAIRRIWTKQPLHRLLFTQNILNLLIFTNVLWIVYKTASMVSYAFLKPFLTLNLIYIVIALINIVFLTVKLKNQRLDKREKRFWIMTIIFTVILCVNMLYWEFYF
ncbi:serine hydrolase domain-containing protein [Alkalihalophilus pseudofirmus]|uniref:Serine hydrolase domain-containing protein n=1 Tax=Alkalihalophilus pseudofirmus TaxID=79885 RepID=A0AAJ2KVS4_ALKPS|nr:serine hydrolase domain-containing protein [Alkalihalophilus pseudofirmus]MDV2884783.1 serine hydrolase domain-containing protein [Alkalihalophilus pseudofirmus]